MNDWKKRLVCNVNLFCTAADDTAVTNIFSKGSGDARAVLITDFDGMIVRPPSPIASVKLTWADMWYLQNLMILQRMSQMDAALKKLKDKGIL